MSQKTIDTDDLEMIDKYSYMVYRLAYSLVKNKYDAEDIHQEVFVRYLCKRPAFANAEHEKAWFLRVTANLCKNFWKTAWHRKMLRLEDFDYEEKAADREPESEIILSVRQLPQRYRLVIHLFYYEELSVGEIAGILKRKESTVRTQLVRARRQLAEILKEADIDV